MRPLLFSLLLALGVGSSAPFLGCAGEDPQPPGGGGGAAGSGGAGSGGAGSGGSDGSSATGDAGSCPIPAENVALAAYLTSGGYKSFPHESAPHASAGPHGSRVLTYITPSLEESLRRGITEHPRCAGMVKEFVDASGSVTGWAVAVKVAETSAGGDHWYWYETFDRTRAASPSFSGLGLSLCKNCHAGGTDFVLSPFPLQ